MSTVVPVILCGGSGTRLWPLSRAGFPKQFLCLTGNNSLFQQATLRLSALATPGTNTQPPLVVCNEEHRFLAQEQLRETGLANARFLLEPLGRNTAPALTLAALAAMQDGTDPVLVVTPADQTITDEDAFKTALQTAIAQAQAGHIAILGVTPDR
ncbi:MAG: sugar phosphate nucleotidyltransferase, partial [Hydrogenophaga sp.]|nr:sugar phosphate nucleotidyltransferase [Hydrogenophaga sp.]